MKYTKVRMLYCLITTLLVGLAGGSINVNRVHRQGGARLRQTAGGGARSRSITGAKINKGLIIRTANATLNVKDVIDQVHFMATTSCASATGFMDQLRDLISNQIKPKILAAHQQAISLLKGVSDSLF